MSSLEVRFRLKKPVFVYVAASCFIVAPIGNVLASMIGFGVYNWWNPAVFARFVENISAVDRAWLLLTFCAGCALFHQRRWSWLLAICALLTTSIFNLHYGMQFSSKLAYGTYFFPGLFMLSNLAVVGVLYHFRYPYLDRREAWWGIHPRYSCHLPVKGQDFSGSCVNISRSGAFLECAGSQFQVGQIIEFALGSLQAIKAEVVRTDSKGYGVQFNLSRSQRGEMKKLIAELHVSPCEQAEAA